MERRQVSLYLVALVVGGVTGFLWGGAGVLGPLVDPALGALLYVTFLAVPFGSLREALSDVGFLTRVLVLNFVVVPIVVWTLSRLVVDDHVLLVGVLFVLLTPCIDYVVVFTGLAGGAREKLLAATPVLMLLQLVLLPALLFVMAGPAVAAAVEVEPFVSAFGRLVLLPLLLAALTQFLARRWRSALRVRDVGTSAMVPLMCLVLFLVVASQSGGVGQRWTDLWRVVPVFLAFAAVMVALGIALGRSRGLGVPEQRALVFSGVTRNSLVVLPLVLALPATFALAPLVVVTQTLVELALMVLLVRLVPRLLPATDARDV